MSDAAADALNALAARVHDAHAAYLASIEARNAASFTFLEAPTEATRDEMEEAQRAMDAAATRLAEAADCHEAVRRALHAPDLWAIPSDVRHGLAPTAGSAS
jgi:hypothetical protein